MEHALKIEDAYENLTWGQTYVFHKFHGVINIVVHVNMHFLVIVVIISFLNHAIRSAKK